MYAIVTIQYSYMHLRSFLVQGFICLQSNKFCNEQILAISSVLVENSSLVQLAQVVFKDKVEAYGCVLRFSLGQRTLF